MSIHVAITRRIRPGKEAEYEEMLRHFVQASLGFPGSRGVQLLHPVPGSGSREYGILRSFASEADRAAFYDSPMFAQWVKDISHLVEGDYEQHDLHGLEAWFRQADAPRPPRWKMAVATLLGVYPTSLVLGTFVGPHLHSLPHPLSALIMASGIVICLTWLVMPLVTKILHPWLRPKE